MEKSRKNLSVNRPLVLIPMIMVLFLALPFLEKVGSGLVSPWQKLPVSPSSPVRLLGTGESAGMAIGTIESDGGVEKIQGDLYIQAADGFVYDYEEGFRTWRPGETEYVTDTTICESTGSLWWRKQGQCLQADEENGPRHYFLLDETGAIWHRRDLAILPSYGFCALVGLAISIGIVIWRWLFNRPGPGFEAVR
jgi:hypothetical protein